MSDAKDWEKIIDARLASAAEFNALPFEIREIGCRSDAITVYQQYIFQKQAVRNAYSREMKRINERLKDLEREINKEYLAHKEGK